MLPLPRLSGLPSPACLQWPGESGAGVTILHNSPRSEASGWGGFPVSAPQGCLFQTHWVPGSPWGVGAMHPGRG